MLRPKNEIYYKGIVYSVVGTMPNKQYLKEQFIEHAESQGRKATFRTVDGKTMFAYISKAQVMAI